jgi:hypothetical protein
MKYTLLTYVPRRYNPPAIGQDVAGAVRERGCAKCVVDGITGKLKPCWEHKDDRILWAVTVEAPEEENANVVHEETMAQTEGLPEMAVTAGAEESVEV